MKISEANESMEVFDTPASLLLVQDLRERVAKLASFDQAYEINAYCDDIETEVVLAFDSAIDHLNDLKKELLVNISDYRNKRLSSAKCKDWNNFKTSIEEFSKEIDQFSIKCLTLSEEANSNSFSSNYASELRVYENQVAACKERVRNLAQQMREQTFRGRFMRFNYNHLFTLTRDHLGTLELNKIVKKEATLSAFPRQPKVQIDHCGELIGFPAPIRTLYQMFSGYMAACPDDGTIRFSDCFSKKPAGLLWNASPVLALLELPNGVLVAASQNGGIFRWGFGRYSKRPLPGHSGPAFSLKLLDHDRYASMSTDNTIKVWHRCRLDKNALLLTITGHDCTRTYSQLGLLSNGYLATCSDDLQNGIIRIWNSRTGRKVKEFESQVGEVLSLLVLENDEIVVGSKNGTLKILSLYSDCLSKTLIGPRDNCGIGYLIALPRGCFLAAESSQRPNLQVWDYREREQIQLLPSNHIGPITCAHLHANQIMLSTCSGEMKIKVWRLRN